MGEPPHEAERCHEVNLECVAPIRLKGFVIEFKRATWTTPTGVIDENIDTT
jgi:hypothetical protein